MARPLRIEYPGAYYHITNRGNTGERIYISQRDKVQFVEYMGRAVERFSIVVHSERCCHLFVQEPQWHIVQRVWSALWGNICSRNYYEV
jgi:hypothetical protein